MPKIRKVVSTVWYNKENYHALRNVFPDAEFVYVDFYDKARLTEEVKDADAAILMGDVDNCLLGENTLQWIHCDHSGLNGSARPEVFARGIPVTGSAGRSAPVLAEHCIYFMLNHCYHTHELIRAQKNHQYGVDGSAKWKGLYGRKVGIIGMGNNGRMLADRLQAMGMVIYGYDKFPIRGMDYLAKKLVSSEGDTLDPILSDCDFIVLTVLLTDETYHMFNEETIGKMKKEACLVNMARGGLVDTEALTKALQEGRIAGAGLDCMEEEPFPADHPLWDMDNVYITPHTTPQVPNRAGRSIEIIRENARLFEAGLPMRNLLRPEHAITSGENKGGFSKLLNSNLPVEEVRKMPLERFLGKRGWTDPKEWNFVD